MNQSGSHNPTVKKCCDYESWNDFVTRQSHTLSMSPREPPGPISPRLEDSTLDEEVITDLMYTAQQKVII